MKGWRSLQLSPEARKPSQRSPTQDWTEPLNELIKGKGRYFISPLLVGVLKIIGGWMIFREFVSESRQTVFPWFTQFVTKGYLGQVPPYTSWLYLFCGWDTEFYVALARNWYFQPLYAFFPAYPGLVRSLHFVFGDYWMSAAAVSIIFGITSLPVFQRLAEHYMTRTEALYSTFVFGFFPYVFLFTTVAYSESLFIFLALSSWLLYKRDRLLLSCLACAGVSLTKIYGIVIVFPIFLDLIANKRFKALPSLAVPVIVFTGWLYYCYQRTGDWLAPITAQARWAETYGMTSGWLQQSLWPPLRTSGGEDLIRLGFVLAFSVLAVSAWQVDWKLGSYSLVMLVLLLLFGTVASLPRFLSFVFPAWLVPRLRNPIPVVVLLVLFSLADLKLWYQFIMIKSFIA